MQCPLMQGVLLNFAVSSTVVTLRQVLWHCALSVTTNTKIGKKLIVSTK